MVIDYSKWDNIDTDSEDEPVVPQPAKVPKPQAPQQTQTQTQPTPTSSSTTDKPSGNAPTNNEQIKAVIVRCDGDASGPKWSQTTISSAHPIFEQKPGSAAPLPARLGIPLIFDRLPTTNLKPGIGPMDNQIATYINIDLESGFAPPAWQSQVGTVLVARLDKKPLLEQHLEAVWQYCDHILDLFGDGEGAPTHLYTRPAFEKWLARYVEEARDMGRKDWDNVPTPYEV